MLQTQIILNLSPKTLKILNVNITICDRKAVNAMLDLEASINLILYLLYMQLGMSELKSTIISL